MEETSLHGVSNNGDSGNAPRPSGCVTASEEGNVDDPPPIPSASSSIHLTEKSVGESRFEKLQVLNENASDDIQNVAHALPAGVVANRLGTDSK